jgi:hypothetical protein
MGEHFNNGDVKLYCETHNIKHITTAAYAPWCNGLIKGANKLLLACLLRLCAPNMDKCLDDDIDFDLESIPHSWPLHFNEAVQQLNDCIRPNILRSPQELLFGLAITPEHRAPTEIPETTPESVSENLALSDMLHMNAHLLQLEDAERQKTAWDERTPAVNFEIGDLVQIFDSKLEGSYKSVNKLIPRWSKPHIITGKSLNSYTLSTLLGTAIPGLFHSCRLHTYIPLRGSQLDSMSEPLNPTNNNTSNPDLDEAEERMVDGTDSLLTSAADPREPPNCDAE